MKQIFLFSFLTSFYAIGSSQDTIKLYLDNNFVRTEKANAVILRSAFIKNNHYYVTDQFINGRMINYGEYISTNPWIEDGWAKHYDEFGEQYSTGKYINGKLSGKWIYYSNEKSDTVDYSQVENYYKFIKDSCKFNEQLISDSNSINEALNIKENLKNFIQNNLYLPARSRNEKLNSEIRVRMILDTDGHIKCPEIIDSTNVDFEYESLRILFLYNSKLKINKPLKIIIPIVFNKKDTIEKEPIFQIVEESASFQGGNVGNFRIWVQQNLIYPTEASKGKIQGKVIVQFAINSKGFLVNIKILRGVHPLLDNEVIRCLNSSPKWSPGRQGGRAVKQQFVIPIIFGLQ